jgi:predicted MFS family arabinose efflux permease
LFAARIVAGIAGAIIPTTYAYIADITSPEDRAKRMGMVGAAFGLGFILGPAIGGLLAPYGYDKPGFFASALAGCNLIFAYFKLPESLKPEIRKLARHRGLNLKAFLAALKHPQIGLLLVLVFVVSFAFSNMEATFGLLNQDVYGLDARHTGYLFTYIGILLGVIQGLLVGRLVRRVGERVCMSLGTLSMVLGLTLMPFAPNIPAYCGIIALIAVGNGINNPSMSSLLSRHSRIDEQGGIMGIAQSMGSLGRILGPIWGGFSYGTIGVRAPFVSAGVVMGIAFLLTLQNFRKQ